LQSKKIIILGTGPTCLEILETINDINLISKKSKLKCVGFLDDNKEIWNKKIYGIKVLGPLSSAPEHKDCFFVNGIGSPKNFHKKEKIISKTNLPLEKFISIIHPSANVSDKSDIGFGVVVFQNVRISINSKIGNHVLLSPHTVISHDVKIGDYSTTAAGVVVAGNTTIGESSYLGLNSSIKGDINVGNKSLIGMGSVVLDNVPPNKIFAGNPAKLIRKNK
jgi:sugar O-acyltransferase (sialic acid O-acetyltransferase NeuD family)